MPVGGFDLAQIPRHALLDLLEPPLQLAFREVVVATVHGFEFGSVDRDAGFRQQSHLPTQLDELSADFFDRRAIVLAEIGDRLVIGREPPGEPHHLEIALALALQAAARVHAIEIAVDVELEQRCGMVGRSASVGRIDAREPQIAKIQRVDENIDRANWIALVDEVIEAFGQQRRLPPIHPLHEARHQFPRQFSKGIITRNAFLHGLGHSRRSRIVRRPGEPVMLVCAKASRFDSKAVTVLVARHSQDIFVHRQCGFEPRCRMAAQPAQLKATSQAARSKA